MKNYCRKSMLLSFVLCCLFILGVTDWHQQAQRRDFYRREEENHRNYLFSVSKPPKHTWVCENDKKCVRQVTFDKETTTLETCMMMCGPPPLWPIPSAMKFWRTESFTVSLGNLEFKFRTKSAKSDPKLKAAVRLFRQNLKTQKNPGRNNKNGTQNHKVTVSIGVQSVLPFFTLKTPEFYELEIFKTQNWEILVDISAENFFGARNGLETLSQLIWYDTGMKELQIRTNISIQDGPVFPYRGLMVDTARQFVPVKYLKRILNGMGASKLNILHLHLTDAQSFPMVLPSNPKLAQYGAYDEDSKYTPEDILGLVEYARVRGVKIVLEIDAPSHMNAGWEYAEHVYNDSFVVCAEEGFGGQLDADELAVFKVLRGIYRDLLALMGDDGIFHLGGDEVDSECWKETSLQYKRGKYGNSLEFWADVERKLLSELKIANAGKLPGKIILWSSKLTETDFLDTVEPNRIVVQHWVGKRDFLKHLHTRVQILYSNVDDWYLDCGFGPFRESLDEISHGKVDGSCDPYKTWQRVYNARPWFEDQTFSQTLGGEVCLWTEVVDVDSLESRIWPRAAAFSERLWSDPGMNRDFDVYRRFSVHRERLVSRGIKSEAIWPRWCTQNPGKCLRIG